MHFLGDFDCELDELSCWHHLYDRGWRDSALLQQFRDGCVPGPTWKAYSRIDLILLHLVLLPLFKEYQNEPDTVSDHTRISVVLEVPTSTPMRRNGRTCRDARCILETSGWQPQDFQELDWNPFRDKISHKDVHGA